VKIAAPYFSQLQVFKSMPQKFSDRFRDQSLPPIRHADPVTNLTLRLWKSDITGFSDHQSRASNRTAGFFQNYSVSFRCRQYTSDNFQTVLHTCVDRPPGYRTNIRMAGIFI